MIENGNTARAKAMFGDYDIIETVGQGGMGIVYRAVDTALGRTVALKVLKDDLRTHTAVVARFQREAQAYATLNHPNIVKIFSVGAVGNIPYIAMELVDGEPLSAIMKRDRKLPWKRALEIGEQIAEALGSAHGAQIIHRDIKPGNILVTKSNHAYVTDFGIAKILTAETQLTIDGSRLGTPQYMSPERCQNAEITFSSDLYSLGIVLFQMICGRLPYESPDSVELIRKIVSEPPQRLSDFVPDIPEDVERLIAFLIEKKVENRPASASVWVNLSSRVRDGKPMIEDDSGLESSIKTFRDSLPTPSSFSDSHFTQRNDSLLDRVALWWNNRTLNVKSLMIGTLVAAVSALSGWAYIQSIAPETASDLALKLGTAKSDWATGPRVAAFYEEMTGLTLVQLDNLDWIPAPEAWLNGHTALVRIDGRPETPWEGSHALLSVDHESKAARIILAPQSSGAITRVGSDPASGKTWFSLQNETGTVQSLYSLQLQADDFPIVEPTQMYAIIGAPANDALKSIQQLQGFGLEDQFLAVGESLATIDEYGIFSFQKSKPAGQSIVPSGAPIKSLAAAADNSVLVYSRQQANGNISLYYTNTNEANQNETQLASAIFAYDAFAIHPQGNLLLAAELGTDGSPEIYLHDLDTQSRTLIFQNATDVQWHPNGTDAVVLAPDRKDINQLWEVSTAPPNPRKQITFLEDGVGTIGTLSEDGSTLLATTASDTKPALIVLELFQIADSL